MPVKSGTCVERFKLRAYNEAEREYRQGMIELEKEFESRVSDEANFHCSKLHFATSVSLLRYLHLRREVECIDALPKEDDINSFSREQLGHLAQTLNELYFHDEIN